MKLTKLSIKEFLDYKTEQLKIKQQYCKDIQDLNSLYTKEKLKSISKIQNIIDLHNDKNIYWFIAGLIVFLIVNIKNKEMFIVNILTILFILEEIIRNIYLYYQYSKIKNFK